MIIEQNSVKAFLFIMTLVNFRNDFAFVKVTFINLHPHENARCISFFIISFLRIIIIVRTGKKRSDIQGADRNSKQDAR